MLHTYNNGMSYLYLHIYIYRRSIWKDSNVSSQRYHHASDRLVAEWSGFCQYIRPPQEGKEEQDHPGEVQIAQPSQRGWGRYHQHWGIPQLSTQFCSYIRDYLWIC